MITLPHEDPIVLAPSPTPFQKDDTVDHGAIERNIGRWLKTPLSGFILNSENGEESFLSEVERIEIVRTVQRARGGQKLIVAGVDSPSVTESLRLGEALVAAAMLGKPMIDLDDAPRPAVRLDLPDRKLRACRARPQHC